MTDRARRYHLVVPNAAVSRFRASQFGRHVEQGVAKRVEAARPHSRYALEFAGARRGALPDYLVIGAMKAGTTTFYDWLVTHPLCPAAVEKEVHFFDFHFPRGETWYRSQLPTVRHRDALGVKHGARAAVGEASPTYLFHPLAPRRVHQVVREAKLIVLLRNPVDRAYSHYQTGLRHDWEALPFEEALDREERRLEGEIDALLMDERNHRSFPRYRWSYQAMGRYAEQLHRWFDVFDRQQFLFVLNEELDRDPDTVFRRVWDFLGLPCHHIPGRERRTVGRYRPLPAATRARLQAYFAPYNAQLEDLLGIDTGWR